jgi:hypothetical protein
VYDFRDMRQFENREGVGLVKTDPKAAGALFTVPGSYTSAVSDGDRVILALYDRKRDMTTFADSNTNRALLKSRGQLVLYTSP